MKNRKQLLADFYLELLASDDKFKRKHKDLFMSIANALAIELESDINTIERIFTRMAAEDK